mmetsp:Transcript_14946/g.35609  ORF Transcript_14946/g.35609 Transcript_14946/m.35609 type:complete len:187 (+) Transcript_14946:1010-1570(+)
MPPARFLHNNGLAGMLPPQWSALTGLGRMYVPAAGLICEGPLQQMGEGFLAALAVGPPPSDTPCDRLLHRNNLFGTLPPQWSELTSLHRMSLYGNSLAGTLPFQWSVLSSLKEMALGGNGLAGKLPSQWSTLRSLRWMLLHSNDLTGTLPEQWSVLTSLGDMRLDSNSFVGLLPLQWSTLGDIVKL